MTFCREIRGYVDALENVKPVISPSSGPLSLLIGRLYIRQSTGKNLYFSMVPLFVRNLVLKMAKNRILLKYSGKNHTFLIKTFEK